MKRRRLCVLYLVLQPQRLISLFSTGQISDQRFEALAFSPRQSSRTPPPTLHVRERVLQHIVHRRSHLSTNRGTAAAQVTVMKSMGSDALAAEAGKGTTVDWTPLVLSLMAGLSTCIGASVVFLAQWRRRRKALLEAASDGATTTGSTSLKGKNAAAPIISHGHLCFSISFAGSVMVTVSLFSLLPESFTDEASTTTSGQQSFLLSPYSQEFWYRVMSFLAGCGLCLLLSKAAFPEPEDVLDWNNAAEGETEEDAQLIQERRIPVGEEPRQLTIMKRQSSILAGADKSLRPVSSSLGAPISTSTALDLEANHVGSKEQELPKDRGARGGWWSRFASGSDLTSNEARRSWRVALLLFVSLLAHNFPEGFAVAASSIHSPKLGITTALAIAFHNIPEGIAIAVPCLAARPDSPWLAFGLASLSGLAEPVGAFVALLVLHGFDMTSGGGSDSSSSVVMDIDSILSFVAGVMVTVACYELFPEARRHTQDGVGPLWWGIGAGAVIMLASDAALDATY